MKKSQKNPEKVNIGRNGNKLNVGGTFENSGRPKGSLNRKTLFDRWATIVTTAKNPLTEQIEGLTQDDLVILSLLNKARKGDVLAIREWLDSRFGKIKESIEVEQIDKKKLRDDFAEELNSIRDNTK